MGTLIRAWKTRSGRAATSSIRNQRGQALAETGLVITILMFMMMGVVEYGRAFYQVNVITHALRDAARQGAVTPTSERDSEGHLTSTASDNVKSRVSSIASSVLDPATISAMTVTVTQTASGGINTVAVGVDVDVPYTFKILGSSFNVNRTVSFRDEGR